MTGKSSVAVDADSGLAGRWRRLSLALKTSLLSFAVVALIGVVVVVVGYSSGDFSDSNQVNTLGRMDGAVLITSFVLGTFAARRGRRAWLAGYAGAVLGGVPMAIVHDTLVTGSVAVNLGSALAAVILFALIAGLAFLLAGGLTLVARRIAGTPARP